MIKRSIVIVFCFVVEGIAIADMLRLVGALVFDRSASLTYPKF